MTPLYLASLKGHGAIVKLLLQQHADVSIPKKVNHSFNDVDTCRCLTMCTHYNFSCCGWNTLPKIVTAICSKVLCVVTEITNSPLFLAIQYVIKFTWYFDDSL